MVRAFQDGLLGPVSGVIIHTASPCARSSGITFFLNSDKGTSLLFVLHGVYILLHFSKDHDSISFKI